MSQAMRETLETFLASRDLLLVLLHLLLTQYSLSHHQMCVIFTLHPEKNTRLQLAQRHAIRLLAQTKKKPHGWTT